MKRTRKILKMLCFICGNGFKPEDKKVRDASPEAHETSLPSRRKVRDHCHFTGAFRGCAHDDCNLGFSKRYFKIPVFLHNLKNYDAHLIINKAHELNKNSKIECIAQF